jgi:hypothetical protein
MGEVIVREELIGEWDAVVSSSWALKLQCREKAMQTDEV